MKHPKNMNLKISPFLTFACVLIAGSAIADEANLDVIHRIKEQAFHH